MVDPRTPVLIGAGQLSNRVDRGEPVLEPAAMMAEATRRAAADAGAPGAPAGIDSIRVVCLLSWRYRDPGRAVAELVGADPVDTAVSAMGGNSPQSLVNGACLDIQAGKADLVLISGAEAWRSRSAIRSEGGAPTWTQQGDDVAPARVIGDELVMSHPGELARGIVMPVQVYPLFEQAHRIALGRSMGDHLVAISELWARFSEVAARNPHAWIREPMTAEQIRTPTPANRWVGFPYTKVMNSNNAVEQSAALLLCSAERADALRVPRDRWVFPLAGTDAQDHRYLSERDSLARSEAMSIAGRTALELAQVAGPDDLGHVDLYSCFPSAVQIAATELGLDPGFADERPLTVTGGLSFAGGPWNNYVTHAIATMADVLREDEGSIGLVSAVGGFLTKHAFGLYSTTPPAGPFRHAEPQAAIDALPGRRLCEAPEGEATVEAWTVMHDRDGAPETGILSCLLDDGQRAWGTTTDADALGVMLSEELAGRRIHLDPDGTARL